MKRVGLLGIVRGQTEPVGNPLAVYVVSVYHKWLPCLRRVRLSLSCGCTVTPLKDVPVLCSPWHEAEVEMVCLGRTKLSMRVLCDCNCFGTRHQVGVVRSSLLSPPPWYGQIFEMCACGLRRKLRSKLDMSNYPVC